MAGLVGADIVSAHPEMTNFRNIGVGLRILIPKILNVWMPVPMFFYRGG